jgi:hypothetical protein
MRDECETIQTLQLTPYILSYLYSVSSFILFGWLDFLNWHIL